ncbi:hypothetical protein QE375_002655 [Microbacterium foliorum]|uniref:DUF2746 domain-containing protein n=2 Tax=Microbacteriaceae TaxID=85023 RepID=A0ABU1HSS4_9MICO|nr:hypothetical protein [Microbacterium foliorum]
MPFCTITVWAAFSPLPDGRPAPLAAPGRRLRSILRDPTVHPQNGSMFVSAEIITIVLSAVGLLLTLGGTMFAGFAWCIRRSDALRTDLTNVEKSLGARIDGVERKLTARIDGVESSLGARIDTVAADTTELKIAMARLEGPQRHLIVATH